MAIVIENITALINKHKYMPMFIAKNNIKWIKKRYLY